MKNKKRKPYNLKELNRKFNLVPIVTPEENAVIKKFYDDNPALKQSESKDFFESFKSIEMPQHSMLAVPSTTKINSKDLKELELYEKAWIQTFSGRKFYPLNPHIDSIVIQDIAHALSLQCRYTGHCQEFYSIAQHCVLVSYICDSVDAFYGLLHDASEAYITDVAAPIKRTKEFSTYRQIEAKLQSLIYKRFGLNEKEPPSVKAADIQLLSTEARDLLGTLHSEWKMPCKPLPFKIVPLPPKEAEALFLDRFNELFINNIIT